MRRNPAAQVRFVGTPGGVEARIVPQAGFDLTFINIKGLVRVGLKSQVRVVLLLPKCFLDVRKLLRAYMPDVVIGGGSYVSGPVVLLAALMRIPTLVMEAHVRPGLTNRTLSHVIDKAAVWYESALPYFHGKGVVTGNPVRREFLEMVSKHHNDSDIHVLIYGGSQAAHAVNEAVIASLEHLEGYRNVLHFLHETGDSDYEKVSSAYRSAGWQERADVRRRIEDMPAAYAGADVIICRAGASTCAEITAAGKAAIMIPFPFAADDHQVQNARALEKAGAVAVILQQDLSGERLAKDLGFLISTPERIGQIETASRKLARPDATKVIVDLVEQLIRRKRHPSNGMSHLSSGSASL